MTRNAAACPDCGALATVVSGACGTWIRCLAGHETKVDSLDSRRARMTLVCAIRDRADVQKLSDEARNDYDDRLAILREHARNQWEITRAAFGVTAA